MIEIEKCTVYGKRNDGVYLFNGSGTAVIKLDDEERKAILRTKFGQDYTVTQSESYKLVLWKPKTDAVFESFREADSYDALITLPVSKEEEEDYLIRDIEPVDIDLKRVWIFRISDEDGEELFRINAKPEENKPCKSKSLIIRRSSKQQRTGLLKRSWRRSARRRRATRWRS